MSEDKVCRKMMKPGDILGLLCSCGHVNTIHGALNDDDSGCVACYLLEKFR
jgi:hypothetical protein